MKIIDGCNMKIYCEVPKDREDELVKRIEEDFIDNIIDHDGDVVFWEEDQGKIDEIIEDLGL